MSRLWLLPAGRREWAAALLAERAAVPEGERRAWLLGAGWMLAPAVLAPLALAIALVVVGWDAGAVTPATPIDHVFLVATAVLLGALPWIRRPAAFPYAALWALIGVIVALGAYSSARFEDFHAFDPGQWRHDVVNGAIAGSLILFGVIAAYAAGAVLLRPRAQAMLVGAAAAVGIYTLMPFGDPSPVAPLLAVAAPLIAGALAGTDDAPLAGLVTGGTGALVLVTLTIPTMLLFPTRVPLEWANPDPDVPHGTPYELRMSVGDAAVKYEVFLLAGPLLGLIGGVTGGALVSRRRTSPPAA